jgi:hypothetical protein
MKSANVMFTARPTSITGMASARLGHMRVRISFAMLRWSSAAPKSKANRRTDFWKKIVSVRAALPFAREFHRRGLL